MKKIVFVVVVLLVGFGFAIFSSPAHAADAKTTDSQSKIYLNYSYVAKLEGGLNNLEQNVLPELKSKIQNNELPAEKKNVVNDNLSNIKINLVAINFSLGNPDLVLLENEFLPKPAPLLAENKPTTESLPATAGRSAKELINENKNVAVAENPVPVSTDEKSKETASVKSVINLKKASLPAAIGLIVALVILWLVWFRKLNNKKDEKEVPAPIELEQSPTDPLYENSPDPQIINLPGPQSAQQHFPDIQ